ncbi:DUF2891 domain-containing protein [Flavihumibacter stibioxidans]|uniref:DUF2891 domain-containing protein n=1 Tax=Flavihumibacter stibioxidans TaxID=1834163 RepID=A0ABR7MAN8_9BACT|nr:DUF2891 domain-containing protein [Flavihumibacter stibioxidans]MBC6492103.1 hypothetical protein [Flavihumibacter stibioxidans]
MTSLKRGHFFTFLCLLFTTNALNAQEYYKESNHQFILTTEGASYLSRLPMKCIDKEFPYKSGITIEDSNLVTKPKNYHPAFYGCFDWHSSVHGHWMLVKLLKQFPGLPEAGLIRASLNQHLSAENIQQELTLFTGDNKSFERIYGWGWLLQLQNELMTWNDPLGRKLAANLAPLSHYLAAAWTGFLPKLVYPIRVGEHSNLAFGLSLSYDYALTAGDTALQNAIRTAAIRFYKKDKNCPAGWEPGGYDFLSPCLEEASLMSRVLPKAEYQAWLKQFMPGLFTHPESIFTIAEVKDVTDGKLVHLNGLNFSRTWCLYHIAQQLPADKAKAVAALARKHLTSALPNIVSGDYAGEHWLGSFAVYALFSQPGMK